MNNQEVPNNFAPFFWDVRLTDIDLVEHKRFVIERLLNEGDERSLQWLLRSYSKKTIRDVVCTSRNLYIKTARFWQSYFHLKEEDMRCFGESLISNENLF